MIDLAGAADGRGLNRPGCSVLLSVDPEQWPAVNLLAIGPRSEVKSHPAATQPGVRRVDATDSVAIPGLVNVHTHLDLTHIGPQPFEPGQSFVDWVDMIRAGRVTEAEAITASVRDGAARSLAGGVVAVGDIAGVFGLASLKALVGTRLSGLSGIELFGIGNRQDKVLDMLDRLAVEADDLTRASKGLGWTWQPHAPYSVGPRLYEKCARWCSELGMPMMTHLSETPEECRFIASGDGLQRDMLERLGAWDETCAEPLGRGESPVGYLRRVLSDATTIAAHVNHASDADLDVLASTRTTVAYCPRASAYFRQHEAFGPHRYRDMLDRGINVALGTDSVVNLPVEQSDRLSTLDDARLIVRRDGIDSELALGMATWRGAAALGLNPDAFSFGAGHADRWLQGVALVKIGPDRSGFPADWVMSSERPAELVRPIGMDFESFVQ